jgi:cytochrome c oxidase cbb3-type subunit 3
MRTKGYLVIAAALAIAISAMEVAAQAPAAPLGGAKGAPKGNATKAAASTGVPKGGGGGGGGAYPQRTPDPAMVARGKALYDVNCALCHGDDARGGSGGPNLLRSEILLNDKAGELVAPVLQEGRLVEGMPKFNFTLAQVSDIAAFIHSFRVGGYDGSRNRPPTIVVGDAKAGATYFTAKCGSCHSADGDLKAIAARIADPRTLQQRWLMPNAGGRGGAPGAPTTVTVTLPSGQKVEGRLGRIDDFLVTLTENDDTPRTFRRDGDTPRVEIHDPIQAHKELLPGYTDKDIHDVTAYLVTLK